MPIELRVPEEDEFVAFMRPMWRGFGNPEPTEEEIADERSMFELDRGLGALDGGAWVGGTGAHTLDLTLPGGGSTTAAGVTMVGVATTHRRQGILTQLMARQLEDVIERGEALAILTASETNIYGRFGYGWAASSVVVEVEALRSGFRTPPAAPGRLQVVTGAEARGLIPAAYERGRVTRAGGISRSDAVWDLILADRPSRRGGDSGLFVVVHLDAAGEPDGFARYRIKSSWPDSLPDNTVVVTDLYGADFEVEATLWRFLLDVDLATRVRVENRPVDDPIRWRLVEPRRLRTRELADYLWARLLDVPRALSLRTYARADGLVLEVVDPFRPASGGRFRIDGGPDGAECAPTTAEPDLVMGPEELGSIYLGGVAPSMLAAAGRVEARTDRALQRADAFFAVTPAPFNGTMF